MQNPTVSFVVPCYKLGHLLSECLGSILFQTYRDFEVLIMDDCSPDNTPEIARSFQDPRVQHVRNEQNLGHLRNYNKGIIRSRGKYVWLISADDRLRRPYVLERYVRLMNNYPDVGYVCCPGIGLVAGAETTLLSCGYYGARDRIFNGRQFIADSLRRGHGLLAPSVMVRKDCYEKISVFPLDMPHQGDWYLWFRWALEYDVGYMCEPMVNYRSHDLNIMKQLMERSPESVFKDEVNVLWRTRRHCKQKGYRALADKCEDSLAWKYARAVESYTYGDCPYWKLSVAQCDQGYRSLDRLSRCEIILSAIEECLLQNISEERERSWVRSRVFSAIADILYTRGDRGSARRFYVSALQIKPYRTKIYIKLALLSFGRVGACLRTLGRGLRKLATQPGTISQS